MPRWYFDTSINDCAAFYYGGCGGNGNNFQNRENCRATCVLGGLNRDININFNGVDNIENIAIDNIDQIDSVNNIDNIDNIHHIDNLDNIVKAKVTELFMDYSEAEESSPPEKCHQRWVNKHKRHGHDGIVKVAVWGCHGDTIFNNKWECETHCVPLPNKDSTNVCSLPKASGPCRAYFPMWFWDNSSNQCKRFVYGGCGGNKNRFVSSEDCRKTCAKTNTNVCLTPKDSGPCRAYELRWFWDNSSGQCKPFVYGGCGGNKNRFESFEDCLKTCAKTGGFSQDYGIMIPPRGHQSPGMWDPRPRPSPGHQWPDRWDQRLPTTSYWL